MFQETQGERDSYPTEQQPVAETDSERVPNHSEQPQYESTLRIRHEGNGL